MFAASFNRLTAAGLYLSHIRIAITSEAFDAIAATLPIGSVGYEAEPTERGERTVWLEPPMVDRLGAMRRPGESYSDVILRIAGRERAGLLYAFINHDGARSRARGSPVGPEERQRSCRQAESG